MIKLQVIGNLGKDCITNTVNGKSVMNFNVAHTEKYKDSQGNQQEKTIWVECAYWSDRTAIAPYLKKGTQVFVEGSPEVRTYQKNDGTNGASLSLRVMSVQLLGTRADNAGNGNYNNQNTGGYSNQNNAGYNNAPAPVQSGGMNEPVDDLPF
jgi:single-strand DNA-binding protein